MTTELKVRIRRAISEALIADRRVTVQELLAAAASEPLLHSITLGELVDADRPPVSIGVVKTRKRPEPNSDADSLDARIVDALRTAGEPISLKMIGERLGVSVDRLRDAVARLRSSGRVERTGWGRTCKYALTVGQIRLGPPSPHRTDVRYAQPNPRRVRASQADQQRIRCFK